MKILPWLSDLLEMLMPRCCVMCGHRLSKSEEYICLSCSCDLPRTHFDLQPDNPLSQMFLGQAKIERATSYLFYYKDNAACQILHSLKYYHQPEIGVVMGRQMATEIGLNFFKGIDVLIPVPLAAKKQKQRGYNQCDKLAEGISAITAIPVDTTAVVRRVANPTQTRKGRIDRWKNVQGIFAVVAPERLSGKHLLLIDDVVTTGATLISCATAISAAADLKISILTLSMTRE